MPIIEVIIPPVDITSKVVTVTRVLTSTVIADEHENIYWHFYNCDPRIHFAEIEFADGAHTFFEFHLSNGATASTPKFGKTCEGRGAIYGSVPTLIAIRPVLAKYTIRGWEKDGGMKCSEVDPEILINEP